MRNKTGVDPDQGVGGEAKATNYFSGGISAIVVRIFDISFREIFFF
jgi:hypothetical protein